MLIGRAVPGQVAGLSGGGSSLWVKFMSLPQMFTLGSIPKGTFFYGDAGDTGGL